MGGFAVDRIAIDFGQNQIKVELNLHSRNTIYDEIEGNWNSADSISEASSSSDAIVIITEWDEFKQFNWKEIKK